MSNDALDPDGPPMFHVSGHEIEAWLLCCWVVGVNLYMYMYHSLLPFLYFPFCVISREDMFHQ